MKIYRNDSDKKTLELPEVRKAQQTRIVAKLLSAFKKIWRLFLIDFAKKNELQVRWETEQFGHNVWKIYDPITGKAVKFSSEIEMLHWIEDYYSG